MLQVDDLSGGGSCAHAYHALDLAFLRALDQAHQCGNQSFVSLHFQCLELNDTERRSLIHEARRGISSPSSSSSGSSSGRPPIHSGVWRHCHCKGWIVTNTSL